MVQNENFYDRKVREIQELSRRGNLSEEVFRRLVDKPDFRGVKTDPETGEDYVSNGTGGWISLTQATIARGLAARKLDQAINDGSLKSTE